MYFFSEPDSNFRIKGSRDPLGFQKIWQGLGRKIIKHVSTVSVNIKDFQVLSYAWYFFEDRDPKDFLSFFYKFEQACAFARAKYLPEDRFNGIDFVRKHLADKRFTFSTRRRDALLSNQKSYGIFGKYNRPFTDMGIKDHVDFRETMESSLIRKVNFQELKTKVDKLLNEKIIIMNEADIEIFSVMLKTLTNVERNFYSELILKAKGEHVQNELYELLQADKILASANSEFYLYSFVETLLTKKISMELKHFIIDIKEAEKVLMAHSTLFRRLQADSIWYKNSISEDPIFKFMPKKINYNYIDPVISNLNDSLNSPPYELAISLINRNKEVCKQKGQAPWIKLENGKLITCYPEGGRNISEFNFKTDFENNYFIPAYLTLFNQIKN